MQAKAETTQQIAPDFTATDVFGHRVQLGTGGDGQPYTLLVFLRYSGCPWCNLAVHRLSLEHKQLERLGCQVIAFIQSDQSSIKENIYGRHTPKPPFPIVADRGMKYYKMYGVTDSVVGAFGMIKQVPQWLTAVKQYGFKNRAIDGSLFVVPAWFLVSTRSGAIVAQERGVSFYDHRTFTGIYESLTFKDE